ncbi:MAG: AMP-binding protein, partial [Thiovulaceae bacterium]|nr:AMP-binding protein [Sulfurimonadaceae bacterium]
REVKEKFGKTILQGYGATETSPVAGCNMPDHLDTDYWIVQTANKPGTVGMPFPGTAYKIVDPESFEELPVGEDGLILIGGVQAMKGYLKDPKRTKEAFVTFDGLEFYKTGDKGHLDDDGYLTIIDRYSRFAKVGGEMVSLSTVEQDIVKIIDDEEIEFITANVPDEKKGEKVILLVTGDIDTNDLRKKILASDINALSIPAKIFVIDAIPILGSGKRDFASTKKLALRLVNESIK